uniref:Uncharacterized protein n=1 Tax=mine drainage metagenome TaxID=410659 RepID=E6PJR4_9ZZZZ
MVAVASSKRPAWVSLVASRIRSCRDACMVYRWHPCLPSWMRSWVSLGSILALVQVPATILGQGPGVQSLFRAPFRQAATFASYLASAPAVCAQGNVGFRRAFCVVHNASKGLHAWLQMTNPTLQLAPSPRGARPSLRLTCVRPRTDHLQAASLHCVRRSPTPS